MTPNTTKKVNHDDGTCYHADGSSCPALNPRAIREDEEQPTQIGSVESPRPAQVESATQPNVNAECDRTERVESIQRFFETDWETAIGIDDFFNG